MALSNGQLATMKADIAANSDLNQHPNDPDGNEEIARKYNLTAVPDFIVWKTRVTITQVGDAINGTELAGLTQVNVTRLQAIADHSPDGVNPSLTDRRQFYADVFSGAGGALTRANLDTLWRAKATRSQKLYATGTGTTPSPGTMTYQAPITRDDVQQARNLP